MIKDIKNILLTEHFSWFVKKGSLALILRVAGAAAGFLLHLLIARLYGPTGTGLYALSLTVIGIALIFAKSGITRALLRTVSAHVSTHRWNIVGTIYFAAMKRTLLTSFAVTICLLLLVPVLSQWVFKKPELDVFLYWMTLAIYPQVLIVIYIQCLRACSHIALAMIIRNISVHLLAIVFLWVAGSYLGMNSIPVSYFGASLLTAMSGWLIWRQILSANPDAHRMADVAKSEVRNFHTSSNTLIWAEVYQTVAKSAPVLVLSIWAESYEVGIFAIALRIMALTGFALDAMNIVVGSKFAAFYEQNEMRKLSRFIRQTFVILFLTAVPMFLILFLAPEWVLGIFGAEFVAGKYVLLTLCLGYFINIICGPMGLLLVMTGHEKSVRRVASFNAVLVILLCVILIPRFGIMGAAMSMVITMVVRNFATVFLVRYFLGNRLKSAA